LMPEILGEGSHSEPDVDVAQLDHSWGVMGRAPNGSVAVRKDNLRYIHHEDNPAGDELYDLSSDPDEQRNILATSKVDAESLRERAVAELEGEAVWEGGIRDVEINELNLRQLRALGYVIEAE